MNTNKQKRMAIINDITGFGRCSVAVAQPIISAMKIQCCALPTAILSAHTAFDDIFFDDYTHNMKKYIDSWKKLELGFDGIYTGFLGSKEQIDIVIDFINYFKNENTKVIVDPVMGDNGELYSSYTDEICYEMRKLLPYADVLTPNLTESCKLLGVDYPKHNVDEAYLLEISKELASMGPNEIVITGVPNDKKLINYIYENKESYVVNVNRIGSDRAGTGDVFASIIAADVVNGVKLHDSVGKATDFVSKAIKYTDELGVAPEQGLCFEEYITELK